jgi:hypothetical protein
VNMLFASFFVGVSTNASGVLLPRLTFPFVAGIATSDLLAFRRHLRHHHRVRIPL